MFLTLFFGPFLTLFLLYIFIYYIPARACGAAHAMFYYTYELSAHAYWMPIGVRNPCYPRFASSGVGGELNCTGLADFGPLTAVVAVDPATKPRWWTNTLYGNDDIFC